MAVSPYQIITDRIVKKLEEGTVPWRQPWTGGGAPRNISGRRYTGVNAIMTAMQGFSSPYWLTKPQITKLGGSFKGQPYTPVIYWKLLDVEDKETGEKKRIPFLKWFKVWNLEQVSGIPADKLPADAFPTHTEHTAEERHAAAEAIVAGYADAPSITERGARAYYSPLKDAIVVPPRSTHHTLDEFYSTLFHEIGHSTGHATRCDRFTGENANAEFGSHAYGREELVAEMTAAFLCAEAGIEQTVDNSAAYLDSWRKTISEDINAVVWAAGRAQKAADWVLGRTRVQESDEAEKTAA